MIVLEDIHAFGVAPVNASHLADRFQLFVLIILGESVARLIGAPPCDPGACRWPSRWPRRS